MYDLLIESKVNDFVRSQKGFTSIDICNAIKTDGTWVRNRDVASWLRSWVPPVGYAVSRLSVKLLDGSVAQASVYLPNTLCVADYTDTTQTAMTPAEFETLHGVDPLAPVVAPVDYANGNSDDSDDSDGKATTTMSQKLSAIFKWPPGSS
jgi:hypothetical protein